MRPLFAEGEQSEKRIDEEFSSPKQAGAEGAEAARVRGGQRAFRPGEALLKLPEGWFARRRAERFATTEDAARACGIGAKLMWILECGGVTSPEIARLVGCGMRLTRTEVRGITCAKTAARRRREGLQYLVARPDGADWAKERPADDGRSTVWRSWVFGRRRSERPA